RADGASLLRRSGGRRSGGRRTRSAWRTTRSNNSCGLSTVTFEFRGPREFTKLVSHHLFRDVHGRELFAVMHCEGEAHEFGRDVAVARPRFDDLLLALLDHFHNLREESRINVRAFSE